MNYQKDGKHFAFNLAQIVYKLFVDDKYKGHLYHSDGNKLNCSISNLVPSHTEEIEEWQICEFNQFAYPSIKWYVCYAQVIKQFTADTIDDFIQESAMLIWKHLGKLKRGEKFVSFAYPYCRWTLLKMKKQFSKRLAFEIPVSWVYKDMNNIGE